jgi:hypothetical protein
LRECYRSQAPTLSGPKQEESLLESLLEQLPRLSRLMQEAATEIYLSTLQAQPPATPSAQQEGGSVAGHGKKNPPGLHSPDDLRPPEYEHGPLTGDQTELAKAICKLCGVEPRPRGLRKLSEEDKIWVVRRKTHSHIVDVYFSDLQLKAQANANLMSLRDVQKRARNDRKTTNHRQSGDLHLGCRSHTIMAGLSWATGNQSRGPIRFRCVGCVGMCGVCRVPLN